VCVVWLAAPVRYSLSHTATMTIKQREEALRQWLLERLKEDISTPQAWRERLQHSPDEDTVELLLSTRYALISIIANEPSDGQSKSRVVCLYAHCLCTGGPLPADELRNQATLYAWWNHIVLQRWWRSWIRYRRFKKFISQPRYSAYLNEPGQLGRRMDNKAQLRWSHSRACQ
jgi:hypothetical protein